VTLKNGEAFAGTRAGETAETLTLAQPGGQNACLKRTDIAKVEPMTVSLMPPGFDKMLSKEELRDLMTYLLTEKPEKGGTKAAVTSSAAKPEP
jgi:putative heme-binding domain-containing protein